MLALVLQQRIRKPAEPLAGQPSQMCFLQPRCLVWREIQVRSGVFMGWIRMLCWKSSFWPHAIAKYFTRSIGRHIPLIFDSKHASFCRVIGLRTRFSDLFRYISDDFSASGCREHSRYRVKRVCSWEVASWKTGTEKPMKSGRQLVLRDSCYQYTFLLCFSAVFLADFQREAAKRIEGLEKRQMIGGLSACSYKARRFPDWKRPKDT